MDAARVNIVRSIFEKGYIVRTNVTWRVAFITLDEKESPINKVKQVFPDKMTSMGTFSGEGKLMTFFPAHDQTRFATVKDFKGERGYIAHFEKGISEKGWQNLYNCSIDIPEKDLDEPINFLKFIPK